MVLFSRKKNFDSKCRGLRAFPVKPGALCCCLPFKCRNSTEFFVFFCRPLPSPSHTFLLKTDVGHLPSRRDSNRTNNTSLEILPDYFSFFSKNHNGKTLISYFLGSWEKNQISPDKYFHFFPGSRENHNTCSFDPRLYCPLCNCAWS